MFKLGSTVTYSTDVILILSNYVLQPTASAHFCSPYAISKEKVATDYRERSKRHPIAKEKASWWSRSSTHKQASVTRKSMGSIERGVFLTFTSSSPSNCFERSKKEEETIKGRIYRMMNSVKESLVDIKHAPRGVFDQADTIGHYPERTVRFTIGPGHDVLPQWRKYVDQSFPNMITTAWRDYRQLSEQTARRRPILPMPEKIHTFRLPLKSIWQEDKDFPLDDINLFVERLNHTAIYLTNVRVFGGRRSFFPPQSQTHGTIVYRRHSITFNGTGESKLGRWKISTCCTCTKESAKDVWEKRLRQTFLRGTNRTHVHSVLISVNRKRSDAEHHPLWTQLKMNIPFQSTKLPVLSTTANTAAKQLATMV